MGLEPMTSPLPRECSTTELHQPSKTNLTILSRTQPSEYDAEGKKSQQNPCQRTKLARLHRLPNQYRQHPEYGQRNHHSTATGRIQIHKLTTQTHSSN